MIVQPRATGLLTIIATLVGCSYESLAERKPCSNKETACIYDSEPHTVCIQGCRDDEDCPVGASCIIEDDNPVCRVEAKTSNRNRLLTGFDIPEMAAKLTQPTVGYTTEDKPIFGPAILEWSAPESAQLVICAQWICAPVIHPLPPEPGPRAIINFDRCVKSKQVATVSAGSFNWRDPDLIHQPEGNLPSVSDSCSQTPGIQTIGEVLVGCWAYDDFDIVAATKLYSLTAAEADLPESIVDCTEKDSDGKTCTPDDETTILGICQGCQCRPRCTEGQSCTEPCAAWESGLTTEGDSTDSTTMCEPDSTSDGMDDGDNCQPNGNNELGNELGYCNCK